MRPIMRVAIIAPNCGWDLIGGGGTYVALNMANVLAEKGNEVHLLSLEALSKNALEKLHNLRLSENIRLHSVYTVEKNLTRIPFPLGYFYLSRFLKRKISEIKPDIVIFHDDALKNILNEAKAIGAKTILYMHFSYKVRSMNPLFFMKVHSGNMLKVLSLLNYAKNNFADIDKFDSIIANSSVTKQLTQQWYPIDIQVLHPPTSVQPMTESYIIKKHQRISPFILSHLSQQDRAFLLRSLQESIKLLFASEVLASVNWKFIITRCNKKFKRAGSNVTKLGFIAKPLYQEILEKSHIINHFKWFEPFGIAILEAMAYGCIPIVYASRLNAAWTDIIEKGKYGYGFLNEEDFLNIVEHLVNDKETRINMGKNVALRASSFSLKFFEQKFLNLVYK